MSINEKIVLIENCMDLEEGSLKPEDSVADYEEWDSLTILSVIAAVDEKYHKVITGEELKKVRTVSDIMRLMN